MTFSNKKYLQGFSIAVSLILSAQMQTAKADSACHYVEQASLDITHPDKSTVPAVHGAINGKPVDMVIGTGNTQTYVLRTEADRQGLNPERLHQQTQGIGGLTSVFAVRVKDFSIGNAHVVNTRFPVVEVLENTTIGGIIGTDVLMEYDVELNFPENRMKLFHSEHCGDKALAYWDKDASSVPIEYMEGTRQPRVQVQINGVTLWAAIDSGSERTSINMDTARKLGFSTEGQGVVYIGKQSGIGHEQLKVWTMPLDSFALGDETVQHPRLAVMEDTPNYSGRKEFQVLLGRDFLQAHRVLLAPSQMQFYYSYTGGPVFPARDTIAAHDY